MGRPAGSTNKKKISPRNPLDYQVCIKCDKEKSLKLDFFSTNSSLYAKSKKYPVCKKCLTENLPPSDPDNVDYIIGVKNVLREINKPFIDQTWQTSIEESKRRNFDLFGCYMKNLALNTKDLTSSETEDVKEVKVPINQQKEEQSTNVSEAIEFTNEDIRAKQDCIKLLGYDPFAGYAPFDQKFLYGELVLYLDEDTLEDQFKISVIIQLLNNNNQIRKVDLLINKLSSNDKSFLDNHAQIKALTGVKSTIATSSDKLAKENSIAIKHRGDKKAGRSTLGYLMKDLRELGFEEAEEDYYDMKKTYGMQISADISMKSIISQLNFDEKDIEDIFKEQRELILELQKQKEELEEKLRLSNLENKKLKKVVD